MSFLLSLLKSSIGSMVARVATEAALEWFLLWAAELAVKSTKTRHDNALLEKVKELLEENDG